MTADVLTFPSRGSPRDDRQGGIERPAPPGKIVEVVGLDGAASSLENPFHENGVRYSPPLLPIVPNLANRPHRSGGCVEGKALSLPPSAQGMRDRGGNHPDDSKLFAYPLTRESKRISGSFVSADILQFRRMEAPNRIRELRNAAGMSQQSLGDAVGCSKMTISDLERGGMELTLDYMRRIARALGVKPADVLLPEDNPDRLSTDERELVQSFRSAPGDQRELIKRVAEPVSPSKAA